MTKTIDTLNADIDRILWPIIQNGVAVERTLHSVEEARLYSREVSGIQTQLRNYKKEINLIKRRIHLDYQTARTNASQHPVMRLFGAKKAANHMRAMDRQNMQVNEHNAILPYDAAIDRIDRCLLSIDQMKMEIERGIQSGLQHLPKN